jgi:hypothetical protein
MGLLLWVALGYVLLLLLAGILAGSLCRVAKLAARHGQTDRGELVLWGSIPAFSETAPPYGPRGDTQSPVASAANQAVPVVGLRPRA